jgi:hypothetical protein
LLCCDGMAKERKKNNKQKSNCVWLHGTVIRCYA